MKFVERTKPNRKAGGYGAPLEPWHEEVPR